MCFTYGMKIGQFELRSRRWIVQVRKLWQFQDFSWFLHIVIGDLRWSSIKLEKFGWKLKTLIQYHEHLKAQLSMLFIAVLCLPTWHTSGLPSISGQRMGCPNRRETNFIILFHSTASWLSPFQFNSFGVGFHSVFAYPLTRDLGPSWQYSACLRRGFPIFALMLCTWLGRCFFSQLSCTIRPSLIFRSRPSLPTSTHFCPPKHRQGFPALKGPCSLRCLSLMLGWKARTGPCIGTWNQTVAVNRWSYPCHDGSETPNRKMDLDT